MFITCWLNESGECIITPTSRNIGTNLVAVALILIDLGKCLIANPFRAKVIASVLCVSCFIVAEIRMEMKNQLAMLNITLMEMKKSLEYLYNWKNATQHFLGQLNSYIT